MALGVTLDVNALAVLKEFYGPIDFDVAIFRNDPILAKIKKYRIGGKYIPVPLGIYGSGAATADYQQYSAQVATSGTDISFQVTPGRLFTGFVLDTAEYLASKGADNRAFISIFAMKALFALDDLRKLLSMCFYRRGYLEQGPIMGVDAVNFIYIDVDPVTAMAISPNSNIMFAATATAAYRSPNAVVVASIANQQATGYTRITFNSAYAAAVAVGDQVMIKGGRDTGLLPNAPVGLGEWLPTLANRTGVLWNAYIATNFYGVNRSIAPDRMAGQFVLQAAGTETKGAAILRGLKIVRRAGGDPKTIVVNDDDWGALMGEALANRSLLQYMNGPASMTESENVVTQGIAKFQYQFSTNEADKMIDSPYCTKGIAYILTLEDICMATLTNAEPITGSGMPTNNEPGAPKASEAKEPTTQFVWLQDEMITTAPIKLATGQGLQVDFNYIGNFIIKNPAHQAVIVFQ
jgi:hypothetical protein